MSEKIESSGGSDVPFPHGNSTKFAIGTDVKFLGHGKYEAHQIAETVTIYATGTAPHYQTVVKLEMLSCLIWPPKFGLFFYEPEKVSSPPKSFRVEQTLHSEDILKTIMIRDAVGEHAVTVQNF